MLIADYLSGFVVTTHAIAQLLEGVADGRSRQAAWHAAKSGLSLRSGYRLWRRFTAARHHLRTRLLTVRPPPETKSAVPEAQLLAHLRAVFPSGPCFLASFQHHFQAHIFA